MTAEPLTPADCDLRDFGFMPLDVIRLRDSDLAALASAEAFRAAVLLWCASWHQLPAASLPDDDRMLARLAGYGRDIEAWKVDREEALRGFVKCSDGRLYHRVIAEKAIEAWDAKLKQRQRAHAGAKARWGSRDPQGGAQGDAQVDTTSNATRNASSMPQALPQECQGTGTGTGTIEPPSLRSGGGAGADAPPAKPSKQAGDKRRSAIAEDTQPTFKDRDHAIERGMTMPTFRHEWGQFRSYHVARRSLMVNWHAAWVTWAGKWVEHGSRQIGEGGARAGPARLAPPVNVVTAATRTLLEEARQRDQQRALTRLAEPTSTALN